MLYTLVLILLYLLYKNIKINITNNPIKAIYTVIFPILSLLKKALITYKIESTTEGINHNIDIGILSFKLVTFVSILIIFFSPTYQLLLLFTPISILIYFLISKSESPISENVHIKKYIIIKESHFFINIIGIINTAEASIRYLFSFLNLLIISNTFSSFSCIYGKVTPITTLLLGFVADKFIKYIVNKIINPLNKKINITNPPPNYLQFPSYLQKLN